MSGKTKIVSVIAVALLATVAVARTVHTHVAQAQATHSTVGLGSAQTMPLQRHGNFACGLPSQAACENIETWFPE